MLASPSDHTPWPVLQNVRQDTGNQPRTTTSRLLPSAGRSFHALSLHHHLVSGSFNLPSQGAFQLSITLLLRYRFRDIFSFRGRCPLNSREISDPRYSGYHHILPATITGLSPSTVVRSRTVNLTRIGLKDGPITPHLLTITGRIQFELSRFHSPLLTASQLISPPAPTQMFQLRAFPILNGSYTRSSH